VVGGEARWKPGREMLKSMLGGSSEGDAAEGESMDSAGFVSRGESSTERESIDSITGLRESTEASRISSKGSVGLRYLLEYTHQIRRLALHRLLAQFP